MKKFIKILTCGLAACMLFGVAACSPDGGQDGGDSSSGGIATGMKPIVYTQSKYQKGEADNKVVLTVPSRAVQTGDEVNVTVRISSKMQFEEGTEAVYYIVDWGDGTWSYQGPGLQSASKQSSISLPHTYKKAGEYKVTATAISMQHTDSELGWTEEKTIRVEGEDYEPDSMIQDVKVISSGAYNTTYKAENVTDGKNTYFKSTAAADIDDEIYVGYLFNENYTLHKLEEKIPEAGDIFPSICRKEHRFR